MDKSTITVMNSGDTVAITKGDNTVIVMYLGDMIVVTNATLCENGEPYLPWIQNYSGASTQAGFVHDRYAVSVLEMLRASADSHYYTRKGKSMDITSAVDAEPRYDRCRSQALEAISAFELLSKGGGSDGQ